MTYEDRLAELRDLAASFAADSPTLLEMAGLADTIERELLTATEQRRALVLCLRAMPRISRGLQLSLRAVLALARAVDAAPGSLSLLRQTLDDN